MTKTDNSPDQDLEVLLDVNLGTDYVKQASVRLDEAAMTGHQSFLIWMVSND